MRSPERAMGRPRGPHRKLHGGIMGRRARWRRKRVEEVVAAQQESLPAWAGARLSGAATPTGVRTLLARQGAPCLSLSLSQTV